ncbi:MAG: Holliday junction resolvase RuvX [Bacilli bacterium]|nr:Holliday junction resolvase RuvX [Bacilli bacterium]
MRYLGLDLGTRTLGISISDETKTIASGLTTLRFEEGDYDAILDDLRKILEENKIEKIVLGLPKNMNNTLGDRAETTIMFQKKIEELFNIEVILQDERLSTVAAHNYLLEADMSRKKRKKVVDKMAANIILQTYLDIEKGRK